LKRTSSSFWLGVRRNIAQLLRRERIQLHFTRFRFGFAGALPIPPRLLNQLDLVDGKDNVVIETNDDDVRPCL
jgi:hypothetical protein